ETQRPDDMRRDLPKDFALDQRLADQPELIIFEIAQPAMHQLGRPGRRPARQVIHFTQENGIAPAHRIARDAAAVDAASDDGEVENPIQQTLPRRSPLHFGDFAFGWELITKKNESKAKAGNRMRFRASAHSTSLQFESYQCPNS